MAAPSSEHPESSVPTPVENGEISRDMPDLGDKENADWQRLRAERRAAREQIISDLRNSTAAEKRNLRQEVVKKRDERTRFDGNVPKNQPREGRPFYERPDPHSMPPMRGKPNSPSEGNRNNRQ